VLIVGCTAAPLAPAATPTTQVATTDEAPTPASVATSQPGEAATEAPTPGEPTPAATANCPAQAEGSAVAVSEENGVCFLYPSSLTLKQDEIRPDEVVRVVGEPYPVGGMDTIAVSVNVAYNGPADGLDSAQYAERWAELNMPGMEPALEPATIGGQPAVIMNEQPGMFPQRTAFVVANGIKYQITLQPRPEDIAELADAATQAWDTVTQSIVFFPPQNSRPVVRPEDVCPQEMGNKLAVNLVDGYCLLHPLDFAPNPDFPVSIVGGPELGPVEGFDSVRASLAVGRQPLGDRAPEYALAPISDQVDPGSVMTTTIAGYPAVIYDFTGGPWRQRNAQILVGDAFYTFVAQPWDAELFPEALPDVERLWQSVSESIAFFDPWR
jgi:hypothetical protein